jgi:transposase
MRNIAYSCECARSTVQRVLRRADRRGLFWPLAEELDDKEIYHILFTRERPVTAKANPDFSCVHKELLRKGVTLMLCWQEYCERSIAEGKEPYLYSAFCHKYRTWTHQNHIVAHIERRPAEQMMVDWAGASMQVSDRDTGEVHKVYIFVACLPYSSYLYAEGFFSMDCESWLTAHINALEYFGGVAPIVVPDNVKTAIIKNTVEELVVNTSYRRLAEYYGFAIVPARPRRPRDKASVETGVGTVTRSAIAPLRNRTFFDLGELNAALFDCIAAISHRPFQKREGSRQSVFNSYEKDALLPLPTKRFEVYVVKTATVPYNYHISVGSIFYSVPFEYVKQEVEVRTSKKTVSVYLRSRRIAMHKRSFGSRGSYVTNPDHMPDTHKDFVEWNAERFLRWASEIGEPVKEVIDIILRSRPIEQQTYRSCRALLALGDKYGNTRLGEVCTRALAMCRCPSYKTVKTLITQTQKPENANGNSFAYLRGADYFDTEIAGGKY